jgi:hypothetical protein
MEVFSEEEQNNYEWPITNYESEDKTN